MEAIRTGKACIAMVEYAGRLNVNSLRPRRDRRHFADDIFKCIFLNKKVRISIRISLKFVPKFRINNIPSLVKIMAWRRPGDKPLSTPMMVSLPTHICVTRPQWVNWITNSRWTQTRIKAYKFVSTPIVHGIVFSSRITILVSSLYHDKYEYKMTKHCYNFRYLFVSECLRIIKGYSKFYVSR